MFVKPRQFWDCQLASHGTMEKKHDSSALRNQTVTATINAYIIPFMYFKSVTCCAPCRTNTLLFEAMLRTHFKTARLVQIHHL